jgi:hypothetical protein
MTRGATKNVVWRIGGRGLIAAVVAALTIAGAFWMGVSWSTGGSPQSASWNSGSSGDASWVSGPGTSSPDDPAVATSDSGAAPE